MKRKFILRPAIFLLAFLSTCLLNAQSVAINTDGTTAHGSALLDIKSTTKGMLAPRMNSAQRTAIATPAAGLFVYDTDTNSFWFYNGTAWGNLSSALGIGGNGTTNFISKFTAANAISNSQLFDNGTNVGINTVSPFAKLHIKGSADVPQLFIDANATQSNSNPLISLRRSDGVNLMSIHSDNPFNTFVGLYAGSVNNATGGGLYNTFIGRDAGASNTTGSANTAQGFQALQLNTTGLGNTANGAGALQSNTYGSENTALGALALQLNTGVRNTATGYKALWLNTIGYDNTANGNKALLNNNGSNNSATGAYALTNNSTGYSNTANGTHALTDNTSGSENTAIGGDALTFNTTASQNTAIGVNALYNQSYNNGGVSWETGNVAVGYNALYLNSPTSAFNGIQNTAVGNYALQGNTTGKLNTASGYASLVSNNAGNQNTAIGSSALYSNTSGNYNTAIGDGALYYLNGGSENIAIGADAGTSSGSPGATNTISIGNRGYPNAANNQVFIGNLSTLWNGGNKTWSTYSDARMKNNIKEEVKGLDFILRLRPVTYYRSIDVAMKITGNKETKVYPEKYDVEKIKETGFLAQEVEKSAKEAGYDFSGVTVPKNSNQLYTLSYEQFVVPLVKAMQEQQAMIKTQQQQIDLLMKRIEILEKK